MSDKSIKVTREGLMGLISRLPDGVLLEIVLEDKNDDNDKQEDANDD